MKGSTEMSEIQGRYIELLDESSSRVIFSAAIPVLEKEMFLEMWKQLGVMLYEKKDIDKHTSYRIRLSGIQHL